MAIQVDFTESDLHFDVLDTWCVSDNDIVDHITIPMEEFIIWLNRYDEED